MTGRSNATLFRRVAGLEDNFGVRRIEQGTNSLWCLCGETLGARPELVLRLGSHLRVRDAVLLIVLALLLTGCATGVLHSGPWARAEGTGGSGVDREGPFACDPVPQGWPDFSAAAEALLAPFLTCDSPAEFLSLQRGVEMPRLVEALDDWRAVRLGARGPMREEGAAQVLQRKRAAFLVTVTERYGLEHAEVFVLFVLHSAHDDEVDAVLRLLARDKQLGQTLGLMPAVREELARRGLALSRYTERVEHSGDMWRGLGRAARDVLATSPLSDGARYQEMARRWAALPPAYQQAAHEVDQALARRHFAPERVAVGTFDALTFGVPLGFYSLAAGTAQGSVSLGQGEYEQATRELAPALLLGAVYAGGRGSRGIGSRWSLLKEQARQLDARLGVEGLRVLIGDLRASREAGVFVAEGGVDAAWVLHESRGDVTRARALMAKAKPGPTGASGLTLLVDESAGLTREWVEARLATAELEAAGPRLPGDVVLLERQRPLLDHPPPGAGSSPRWPEYVAYYERRTGELKAGESAKGPLHWDAYARMWGGFIRGLEFERRMVKVLRADAALPRSERRYLRDFEQPRIETSVGVTKLGTGLCFADVLVLEAEKPVGRPRRVETFSFKSRDLADVPPVSLKRQMIEDAKEASRKYGGQLDIRRESLLSWLNEPGEIPVQRVRVVYEGGGFAPTDARETKSAVAAARREVPDVEVMFQ